MTDSTAFSSLTKKERFSAAIQRMPIDRPPVWFMRQAGRYLPAYQEIKRHHSFLDMCRNPKLAAEVSLQPFDILDVDAIIVFNDILIPLESLGQSVDFTENGPAVSPTIRCENDVASLSSPSFDRTPPVHDSIREIRRRVGNDVPILGFAGAPFTMAAYMIEGTVTRNLRYIKEFRYRHPSELERLLEKITETAIAYLRIQIRAGADAVQIFDTWAGSLSHADYRRFALPYQQQIVTAIQHDDATPVIIYVNGSSPVLNEMKESGASVLSVDWRNDLSAVYETVGGDITLQGNLDPAALFASPETVSELTGEILTGFNRKTGHIFNLGHGILPETPLECVQAAVETVQSYAYSHTTRQSQDRP